MELLERIFNTIVTYIVFKRTGMTGEGLNLFEAIAYLNAIEKAEHDLTVMLTVAGIGMLLIIIDVILIASIIKDKKKDSSKS